MIFDYRRKKFIDDGKLNILMISGIKFAASLPAPDAIEAFPEDGPNIQEISSVEDPIIEIKDNRLNITCRNSSGKVVLRDIVKFIIDSNLTNPEKEVLPESVRKGIQEAIDLMADRFGLLRGIDYKVLHFNDRLMLYMYPILRDLCPHDTNFRKLFNEVSHHWKNNDFTYNIHEALCSKSLKEAIQKSCGTYSKPIMKWITNGLIETWDMHDKYKFLDSKMIGKMLGDPVADHFSLEYKNVLLPERLKVLHFYGDIFDSNTGFINQALKEDISIFTLPMVQKVTQFLKDNFSEKKIIKLLKEESGSPQNPGLLTDIVEQYNRYSDPKSIPPKLKSKYPNGLELPKFQTLKELHDKVSRDYNEIKTEEANRPFEFTEEEWKLHKYKVDNVEIVLPSEASIVVDWGKQLKHCIASYTDGMARKEYLLLGVKVNGKLLYTLQINIYTPPSNMKTFTNIKKRYQIRQFYGYKNHTPEHYGDEKVKEVVNEILDDVFTLEEAQCVGHRKANAL